MLSLSALILSGQETSCPQVVDLTLVHSQLLMLHLDEGKVIYHGIGQRRNEDRVIAADLDATAASDPGSYRISCPNDSAYKTGVRPLRVGRKSKGTEFAWHVDKWEGGRAVNTSKDHAKEHWLYLSLPAPLKEGKTYSVELRDGLALPKKSTISFSSGKLRSESIHVNLLGWQPEAPSKYGYLYHWAGDLGGIDFKSYVGAPFRLLKVSDGRPVFEGKVVFRKPAATQETFHINDSRPHGSFLNADVYECDFSSFSKEGSYVLSIPGIGCSFPFEIGENALRPAYFHTARALYHNRSGIALKEPFTTFTRPAPHNPMVTPGFKGKLMYTTVREQEWGSEGGVKEVLEKGFKGPLESVYGWYQDAGDWDGYSTHLRVAQELMFAYEVAPQNFRDGDLNIPESGNRVPDILDEAAWLPRYCHRLRQELLRKKWGTGGVSLRVAGDAFGSDGEGVPSYLDVNRIWAVAGEDPLSTYRYAGAAAHLRFCLNKAGVPDPQNTDWAKEAVEAYAWAAKNTRPGDEASVKPHRAYASAALFRLTGEDKYQIQLAKDTEAVKQDSVVWGNDAYPLMVTALGSGKAEFAKDLADRLKGALLNTADQAGIETPARRALRWGGDFYFPMLIGQQTTPLMLETAVAYAVVKQSNHQKAKAYYSALCTTADYFLGTDPLNQTWITGVGERFPTQIFHMDAWYNGKGAFHPGLIPYSPWRFEGQLGEGPWSPFWAHRFIYPAEVEKWPGAEQWFSNRCSPMGSEFTIHQNIGPAAALYGILAGKA